MRGDVRTEGLFCYVSCEQRVPQGHPLRRVLPIADAALDDLCGDFAVLYAPIGRPSIPPEKLLRALLLQAFYSVRSERQLIEQLSYNLLFRWFVGLAIDDPVWDVTVFTKNRERLLEGEIAAKLFQAVLGQPEVEALLSDDHFTVDGTLIEAFASMKSFKPKAGSGDEPPAGGGRNAERDFHGEKRRNATHASTTDREARLTRKGRGKEAKLGFMGHLLMENRHGLLVDALQSEASGTAERAAALTMLARQTGRHRITLGADKAYDVAEFVADLRVLNVTPHVAQNTTKRRSAIDRRTTRRLRDQPAAAAADRGELRLDQDGGGLAQDAPPRHGAGRLAVHADGHRLQPDPPAQAAGGGLTMRRLDRGHPTIRRRGPDIDRLDRPIRIAKQARSGHRLPLFPQPASGS